MAQLRPVEAVVPTPFEDHGRGFRAAGVRPARGLDLDPFLGIDHFHMAFPFFAPHPHAGFSAVTYLFPRSPGGFRNRDSGGTDVSIHPGDLHWTQAGSGIVHDEVPAVPGVDVHGLQLFVNLATEAELTPPRIHHVDAADVPTFDVGGAGTVRVVVGRAGGVEAAVRTPTDALLVDVDLAPGGSIDLPLDPGHRVLVLGVEGDGAVGAEEVAIGPERLLVLGAGEALRLAAGPRGLHVVLLGGTPVRSPKVWGGSFALSTAERLHEARARFARGDMGRLAPLA